MAEPLFWGVYLARGAAINEPNNGADVAAVSADDVTEERANRVLEMLGEIFRDRLCLTPFSRTMAVEFVKKQVARGGDHFSRVLLFILNTINNKPHRSLAQRGCPNMIPNLRARPFWNKEELVWPTLLEANFESIRAEFMRLRDLGENFQPYRAPQSTVSGQDKVGSLATSKGNWNVCYLRLHEMDFSQTLDLCPATDETIRSIPRQYNHALFSALAPNTHVAAHCGPTNKKLRCHLPLVVPGGELCSITVNGETVYLQEGKCVVFDDSFYHEAMNASDKPRVVLIVDVWHPDLSDEEVKFLSFLDKAQFRAAARQVKESQGVASAPPMSGDDDAIAGLKPETDENFFDVITRAKNELQSPKSEIWG